MNECTETGESNGKGRTAYHPQCSRRLYLELGSTGGFLPQSPTARPSETLFLVEGTQEKLVTPI